MGEDRENRLKHGNVPSGHQFKKIDIFRILTRWKFDSITPKAREYAGEALLILKQIEEAAETDREFVKLSYPEGTTRAGLRDAELLRSGCMLHAIAAARLMISKSIEQDDADSLGTTLKAVTRMADYIYNGGFFDLQPPPPRVEAPYIKKTHTPEFIAYLAGNLLRKIGDRYTGYVYGVFSRHCEAMGVKLYTFDELVAGAQNTSFLVTNASA